MNGNSECLVCKFKDRTDSFDPRIKEKEPRECEHNVAETEICWECRGVIPPPVEWSSPQPVNKLIRAVRNPYYQNKEYYEADGYYDFQGVIEKFTEECDFMIIRSSNGMFLRAKENFNGGKCDCCSSLRTHEIVSYEFYQMIIRENGRRYLFGECNNGT
jgi:hypothetical protein